ncbi:hypothetical protein MY04_3632 [Flammeovirga sp. MY04]|uniref:hypothetical protein n=1 Tax=Flammeovirga sp. MY04 TaxID=1191459 RepID=UPI000806338B|nr:hypothetical protein [Flammeovirga sp. MY04]ANQ50980.1 hypothetical protein MY04_3632 [Flammeovirga sp. MY04]
MKLQTNLSSIIAILILTVACSKNDEHYSPQEVLKSIDLSYASSIFIGPNHVTGGLNRTLYKVKNDNEIDTVEYINNFGDPTSPKYYPDEVFKINEKFQFLSFQGVENYIIDSRNGNAFLMENARPINHYKFFTDQFIETSRGIIYLGNDHKIYSFSISDGASELIENHIQTAHDGDIMKITADPKGNILYTANVGNKVEVHLYTVHNGSSRKIDAVERIGVTLVWPGLKENELFYYTPDASDKETAVYLVNTETLDVLPYGNNNFVLSCGLNGLFKYENKILGIGCNEIYELVNDDESREILITSLEDYQIVNFRTADKSLDHLLVGGINTLGRGRIVKININDYSPQYLNQLTDINPHIISTNTLGESVVWGTSQHNGKSVLSNIKVDGSVQTIFENGDGVINGLGKLN